jgi:hypothetical protein
MELGQMTENGLVKMRIEVVMATPKKKKKTACKKDKKTGQTDSSQITDYDYVYDSDGCLYGTIANIEKLQLTEENIEKVLEKQRREGKKIRPPLDSCIEIFKKLELAEGKSNVKLSDYDLRVLLAVLAHYFFYQEMEGDYNVLKRKLAWANTAFKNEGNSYEKNLREAGRRLGFTKGAEVTKDKLNSSKFDPFPIPPKGKKIYYDPDKIKPRYKELRESEKTPLDAVRKIKKEFNFPSIDNCARYLRKLRFKKVPTK